MKSVIVGTAGHIDHGKTALVKALTGIDADRLEEEKRRGITIDIGFAHLELPAPDGSSLRLGFVDVPGHERFVRNMLAGVGGIDLVLLVIAADESIKPQTREHFDICRLLAIDRGITVLTKSDAVDADTLAVTRLEVEEFLRGSFLDASRSPVVPVSSLTGAGLADLRSALAQVAAETRTKDAASLPRLPIDRVFSMKGFGTVVTGTLVSGTIRREDVLQSQPGEVELRVRGVQVHSEAPEQAIAGERTALNLAGIEKAELSRGTVLVPPSTFQSTSSLDASISLLTSSKPLRDRAQVHLHAFTAETIATVNLYQAKQIAPGETSVAKLRLAAPMMLLPGDRFILRQFSPLTTIGGGAVLDAAPLAKIPKTKQKAFLDSIATAAPEQILHLRIARTDKRGTSLARLVAETGWRAEIIENRLQPALESKAILRAGYLFIAAEAMNQLKSALAKAVAEFHRKNPLVAGISKESLREASASGPEIFAAATEALRRENKLELSGEIVRVSGRGVVLKDEEAESKKSIEYAFSNAGLQVPALKEVLAGLKIDKVRAQKLVTLLLRDKALIKVSDDLVFHRVALEQLRNLLLQQKPKSPQIDVARFKDLAGVSRKYAIPLLEYLDREHVTKRVGNERVIL